MFPVGAAAAEAEHTTQGRLRRAYQSAFYRDDKKLSAENSAASPPYFTGTCSAKRSLIAGVDSDCETLSSAPASATASS